MNINSNNTIVRLPRLFRRYTQVHSLCLVFCALPMAHQTCSANSCLGGSSPRSFSAGSPNNCGSNPYPTLSVGKFVVYEQTGIESTRLRGAYYAASVVQGIRDDAKAIKTVGFASVTSPGCGLGGSWLQSSSSQIKAATQEELDRIAPAGDYYLNLMAGGQQSQQRFSMPESPWPSIPLLENFAEAQSIDTTSEFVVKLRADTDNVYTRILISPVSANAASFFYAPPCSATSSDVWSIPANSLAPSASYMLHITSARRIGSFEKDGMPSLSLECVRVTQVMIKTKSKSSLPPAITTQPGDVECVAGASARFSVSATGGGPFSYQWYNDGSPISGATAQTITISRARKADDGFYQVAVTGPGGKTLSRKATLKVWVPPAIVTQPRGQTKQVGDDVKFTVAVSGTSPFQYRWYKDGKLIPRATGSSYTIRNLKVADSGDFSVKVKNQADTVASRNATLKVRR